MAKTTLADTPTDVLRQRLKAVTTVLYTVIGIFTVIILAWVVLGLWRTNVPIFISTVSMGVAISALQVVMRNTLVAELRKRETA